MAKSEIKQASPLLKWLVEMAQLMNGEQITIPAQYRDQVLAVKDLLENDVTGLVNTLLDFSINAAVDVDYIVETNNTNLSEILNNWLYNINSSITGVPTGIEGLAKEYYRERWKGSSFLLLRTVWETVDGISLPTKMWFVDGEDIVEEQDTETVTLGDETYKLRVTNTIYKTLPTGSAEKIYVQKPYESWGTVNTTPFLIQRGLYKNAKLLEMLFEKSNMVIAKALEYLLLIKKGTEGLAKEGRDEFIYSNEDLRKAKEAFGLTLNERSTTAGITTYMTNFDTELEHIIPEYERALKSTLYAPIEKRILAGLGMVDIVEGATSTRRESILNPKPFIGEVKAGITDFKVLMRDVMADIIRANKPSHKKFFSDGKIIEIRNTPVKIFMTEDYKGILKGMYDRGILSKRTYCEVCGEMDFDQEIERRKSEIPLELLMYPPVVQNTEQNPADTNPTKETTKDPEKEGKTGPEATDYNNANLETSAEDKIYEEAPYKTNNDLPDNVKSVLPARALTIWRTVFNNVLNENPNNEDYARKTAWSIIKKLYTKKDDKWVKKSKGELEESLAQSEEIELMQMKKLEVLGKQAKLLDKLIGSNTSSPEGDK